MPSHPSEAAFTMSPGLSRRIDRRFRPQASLRRQELSERAVFLWKGGGRWIPLLFRSHAVDMRMASASTALLGC